MENLLHLNSFYFRSPGIPVACFCLGVLLDYVILTSTCIVCDSKLPSILTVSTSFNLACCLPTCWRVAFYLFLNVCHIHIMP